jgi:hypothetical protein
MTDPPEVQRDRRLRLAEADIMRLTKRKERLESQLNQLAKDIENAIAERDRLLDVTKRAAESSHAERRERGGG